MDAPAENAASSPLPNGAAASPTAANGNGAVPAESPALEAAAEPAPVQVVKKEEPRLYKFLRFLVAQKASDLHIKSNMAPHIRLKNRIVPIKHPPLSAEYCEEMALEILDTRQKKIFFETGAVDVAQELKGSDRFRINIFRQRGLTSFAVRRVTRNIPSFMDLNLPPAISHLTTYHAGLVLLAGITGAGKSTTIAATLEFINQTRACHMVTIEDPIEYLYTDKKAIINQREVGIDVPNFPLALKYLMREDPDVVLIGEMRDTETFQAALGAAETGHLVFGTIHSSSASSTIGRILDLYPAEMRELARQSLAFNLRAIVVQKLLPSIKPGVDRVPVVEILLINPSARQMIADSRDSELVDVIRSSEHEGMQDFNRALMKLIETDFIEPKIAFEASPNADELRMLLKGITSSRAGSVGR